MKNEYQGLFEDIKTALTAAGATLPSHGKINGMALDKIQSTLDKLEKFVQELPDLDKVKFTPYPRACTTMDYVKIVHTVKIIHKATRGVQGG